MAGEQPYVVDGRASSSRHGRRYGGIGSYSTIFGSLAHGRDDCLTSPATSTDRAVKTCGIRGRVRPGDRRASSTSSPDEALRQLVKASPACVYELPGSPKRVAAGRMDGNLQTPNARRVNTIGAERASAPVAAR